MADEIVKRKPRVSATIRTIKRFTSSIMSMIMPTARYGMLPVGFYYAIVYTEPSVSFFEIVNPFW